MHLAKLVIKYGLIKGFLIQLLSLCENLLKTNLKVKFTAVRLLLFKQNKKKFPFF
ncbi:hypothetical protein PI23P_12502 [Polaribacter irgensii 23-P]|uniref:Uncharacterized protein n=1 Tax=Polaribacter irgensii 23-P TaxID=313594 RepID=A4C203_9FLAO|nr:hypothetical protein PI23P_12502 [Polaribacter irgensii 23-P]